VSAQTATASGNSDFRVLTRGLPPPIPPQRQQQEKPRPMLAANDDLPFLE